MYEVVNLLLQCGLAKQSKQTHECGSVLAFAKCAFASLYAGGPSPTSTATPLHHAAASPSPGTVRVKKLGWEGWKQALPRGLEKQCAGFGV